MQAIFIRWAVLALMVVAAAVGGYVHGVRYEEGRQSVEKLAQANAFIEKQAKRAAEDRAENARVSKALDEERDARGKDKEKFDRRLANVPRGSLVEVACPSQQTGIATGSESRAQAPAAGSADVRLSGVACSLWNDALSAGLLAEERAGWPADADACAGPVEVEDALRNLRDAAALLGECRTRERESQRWLKATGQAG